MVSSHHSTSGVGRASTPDVGGEEVGMALNERLSTRAFSRRTAIKAGVGGALAAQAALLDGLVTTPQRLALAAGTPSDIQFDIGAFIPPAQNVNGIPFSFPPVFTG